MAVVGKIFQVRADDLAQRLLNLEKLNGPHFPRWMLDFAGNQSPFSGVHK
jgi:hypothetical protein